jgi:hypothetical protein
MSELHPVISVNYNSFLKFGCLKPACVFESQFYYEVCQRIASFSMASGQIGVGKLRSQITQDDQDG